MISYSNSQTKDGFAMSGFCADGAWHLVSPDAQLRVTGDVRLQETALVEGAVSRDRIVTAGATFPGTPAWRPPT
ncbi:hypothetical protein G7072_14570 [Nocardioides sp. HDW12B]|uniref:hypothetical protein n=1 Tax=Nocardioides sp. HDW12B TaxID=2714939 RepID=UPI00140E2ED7|nr:hypothetical protein [Nocardioides sp. HDW12B]QIK67402.1 hypothetical protein G7072_14570 [Nocardioides sp. HDW12B]